jgi:two-component system CheB/CheR fusion protein
VRNPEGYLINKAVRDRCVFAKHDITRDAPFRNLDLLSCRNLLIYLNTAAHQRLIPLFHFTLKPTGYLILGSAETIGGFGELFNMVERRYKIYSKKLTAPRRYFEFPRDHVSESAPAPHAPPMPQPVRSGFDMHRAAADQILLSQHGPPAVLVNESGEILHFRGHTSPYLEPAQGAASLKLLRMAREGLLVGLEKAMNAARKKNAPARQENLRVVYQRQEKIVDVSVLPIRAPGTNERTFLIIFERSCW